jgi:hypothetical protein
VTKITNFSPHIKTLVKYAGENVPFKYFQPGLTLACNNIIKLIQAFILSVGLHLNLKIIERLKKIPGGNTLTYFVHHILNKMLKILNLGPMDHLKFL